LESEDEGDDADEHDYKHVESILDYGHGADDDGAVHTLSVCASRSLGSAGDRRAVLSLRREDEGNEYGHAGRGPPHRVIGSVVVVEARIGVLVLVLVFAAVDVSRSRPRLRNVYDHDHGPAAPLLLTG